MGKFYNSTKFGNVSSVKVAFHPVYFTGNMAYSHAGRQILWEPGNQVPTKCLSLSEFFGRIHALSRIDKFNRRM